MAQRKTTVIGFLGPVLDSGKGPNRWERWRPTVALCQHEDLLIDRLELLCQRRHRALAETIAKDIGRVSPETTVFCHDVQIEDPWSLEEVYGALHDFARSYPFAVDQEDYLIHITTGTHIAQICMFLLTESRHFPGKLVQTLPGKDGAAGAYATIDLDLSKYDRLASRFRKEQAEALSFLKSGIDTKNPGFNRLIERLEKIALNSPEPLLLLGPTGSGKSQLAKRIYELKRAKKQVLGELVEVNCATLRGDAAMATLFGHTKGAFTGAVEARGGLLRKASQGVLFLDEIGELGPDEQAMLLRATEDKVFYPVGSDKEVVSEFQLIAGTNRDLGEAVAQGTFREDLLARINLWTFRLPSLRERPEDIDPNLEYELTRSGAALNRRVTFSKEARERFMGFARSAEATWRANFRDFAAAVRRMATLADGGRISVSDVEDEITRLRGLWQSTLGTGVHEDLVAELLGARATKLDRFERVQLADVLAVCRAARSLSAAGRVLFAASLEKKSTKNDADRLRKYLARFDLDWPSIKRESAGA